MGEFPFLYLGLPVGVRPNDKAVWSKVLEQITNWLESWENHFLSFGGRVVLTNSVLTSLPIYFLSFFTEPPSILNHIKKLIRHLVWGGIVGGKKKVAWVNWEKVCLPKIFGGLGVKNLVIQSFFVG